MPDTLVIGVVAYDPKVITIWDGFKEWFAARNLPFDYIAYSNYERQVEGHFAGHYHAAWNSPLAWLQASKIAHRVGRKAKAIAMRDTDRDLTSVVVARSDSPIQSIEDLRGKKVAVGAADSPQATLIPLEHLARTGLRPHEDFEVVRFDILLGKHGDHIGGERDAARALIEKRVDAACMIDLNHLLFTREGTIPSGATRILAQTEKFDHCNFSVLDDSPKDLISRFRELLLSMSYEDPVARPLLDLEGLKAWKPGRTDHYRQLSDAIERFGTVEEFVTKVSRACG